MFSKEYINEYITDVQYFEGFIGAFGTIFTFIFFRRILKLKNMSIIVGLSFMTTWILRKSLMNIYKKLQTNDENENEYNVFIFNNEFKGVNLYILFIILVTTGLAYTVSLKKISHISILIYLFFITFFYFFVKK